MRRNRSAKIIATLGPASASAERIRELFETGADVFRLNCSHSSVEELEERIKASSLSWSVAGVAAGEIDRVNVLEATRLAMHQCLASLRPQADCVLVDAVSLVGPKERIVERLQAWKAAAAKRHVDAILVGARQPEALKLLAETVL